MGGEASKSKKSLKGIKKQKANPLTTGLEGDGLKKALVDERGNRGNIPSAQIQKPPTSDYKRVGTYCYTQNPNVGHPKLDVESRGNRGLQINSHPHPSAGGGGAINGKVDVNGSGGHAQNASTARSRPISPYAPSAPVMGFDDTNVYPATKWTVSTDQTTNLSGGVNERKGVKCVDGVRNPPPTDSKKNQTNHAGTYEQAGPASQENEEPGRLSKRARRRMQKGSNGRENGDEPPKYEDVVREHQHHNEVNKKKTSADTGSNPSVKDEENLKKPSNITTSVDELNDLIRKKFGSVGGAIHTLGHVDMADKPFPGRNRLFIRNLPASIERKDLELLLSPYSEITVDFIDRVKRSCCVRLKHGAEVAQRDLDGALFKGRHIRVHFDNRGVRFKVVNITPWVTNELLKKAFSIFGEIERAEVLVDEDGEPTGEGYLEFAHPKGGEFAYEACKQGCFALTASLRPVVLEKITTNAGVAMHSEARLPKNNPDYQKAREVGPRFVAEGSAEYRCALMWKELAEKRRKRQDELARKFEIEEEEIRARIETIRKPEFNRKSR